MKMVIVIPVRLPSLRLSRKPLQLIQGRPLLHWVVEEVLAMDLGAPVVVAADSREVCTAVAGWARGRNVQPVLVDRPCRNGTERVAELLRAHPEYHDNVEVVVNVQADQLHLPVEAVLGAVDQVLGEEEISIGTAVVDHTACLDLRPQCVEALMDMTGRCLSFWRRYDAGRGIRLFTPPTLRTGRHVGVYAYRPATLWQWALLPPIEAEGRLGLEQLRPLVAGMPIGAAWLTTRPPYAIDTPEDLAWVRQRVAAVAAEREDGV